ncbi:hypothetical protein GQ54DRAFT_222975 [Martensiomyces pterosporus]|nr:hypothetical protein GQ54DRAFT_222975 [Martensiomyces pterosporus]
MPLSATADTVPARAATAAAADGRRQSQPATSASKAAFHGGDCSSALRTFAMAPPARSSKLLCGEKDVGAAATKDAPAPPPWWLDSDGVHAHTACPLRPFAHMIVELPLGVSSDSCSCLDDKCTQCTRDCAANSPIGVARLASARVVHLSEALRRKLHAIAPDAAADSVVADLLQFSAKAGGKQPQGTRLRSVSSGLWSVLGWLVGTPDISESNGKKPNLHMQADAHQQPPASGYGCINTMWPRRRRKVAVVPGDDPLLVGNEGLGSVELASVKNGKHSCVFALCAHALSPPLQHEWKIWRRSAERHSTRRRSHSQLAPGPAIANSGQADCSAARSTIMAQQQQQQQQQLAIVHVAEVSTLHQVACGGLDSLIPPPIPIEQYFARMLDSSRSLGPPPTLPPLLKPDPGLYSVDSRLRWMSLLVSRHGLVEMAYPLNHTQIVLTEDGDDDDPSLESGPQIALASLLGESVFSRIHPEDVGRVVKALRLAWDARPDAYHFSRLRREWQRRRLSSAGERAVSSAPSTPPLRPHRAATLSSATGPGLAATRNSRYGQLLGEQSIYHREGIEIANGAVELNVQIQLTGAASDLDWDSPDSISEHTRFARMKLSRWPLILKPPRSSSYRSGMHDGHGGSAADSHDEPQDGFILVGLQPLPEPSRTRISPESKSYDSLSEQKKRSISSVASTSTLVGLGVSTQGSSSLLDSTEVERLCRSTSSLSCQETTARPSIECADDARQAGHASGWPGCLVPLPVLQAPPSAGGMAIPAARPIVGLSNNVVQAATAMSSHASARRRRSSIIVGSLHNVADELSASNFGTPREFAD